MNATAEWGNGTGEWGNGTGEWGNGTGAWGNGTGAWGPGECDTDWDVSAGSKLFRFVVHGVLLNGIACAGVLGNALAVVVLSRPAMRSSINCLLVGLAAADTALIATSVLLFGLTGVFPYTGRLRHYYRHVCPRLTPLAYPLANAAQTMSVYLTLVVTLERWVAVCRPFRAKALCTAARARWYVLATALFALAYNAPKFLEAEVYRTAGGGGAGGGGEEDAAYCVRARVAFRNPTYVSVYIHWLYLVVMYAVPFTLLAALNACIVRQVRRAQRERARLSRGQRRELSLATMLLAVVLVFFLCNLPPLVTNALEAFRGDDLEALDPLVKVSNLLVTINSSVNFLIYVIFGEKFKRVFVRTFCSRWAVCGRLWGGVGRAGGGCGGGRGRESPDHTRDDSFASCERVSLRLTRDCTLRRSDGRSVRLAGAGAGAAAGAGARALCAPAPAPTVYLPAARAPHPAPHPHPAELTSCTLLAPDTPDEEQQWNGHARHQL